MFRTNKYRGRQDAGNDNHSLMNAHKWMKTFPGFHSTSILCTPKFDPVRFVLKGPYIIYMDIVYVGFAGAKTDHIHFMGGSNGRWYAMAAKEMKLQLKEL